MSEEDFFNRNRKNRPFDFHVSESIFLPDGGKNKKKLPPHRIAERQKTKHLLKQMITSLGLTCKITNVDLLEFYCQIYHGKIFIANLYKGWDRKEFHIHDEIKISRLGGDFKERFYRIHDICQTNNVALLFPPIESKPNLGVVMQMAICEHGLNQDVLEWAFSMLERCRGKIKPLLKSK